MNSLERTLIEKAGYAHGWENIRESNPERVVIFSARHKADALITPTDAPMTWQVTFPKGPPTAELSHSLPDLHQNADTFQAAGEAALGRLLRRAAELAMSLPNQAADTYTAEVAKIETSPPSATEAIALVKRRVGQDLFRKALMEYWEGKCSLTGIAVPELLRASHAKPWADCTTDDERLNVYNGFLLCAHLDALFDRGLMTFDSTGTVLFSSRIDKGTREALNLSETATLRWLTDKHGPFLEWHRENVFRES